MLRLRALGALHWQADSGDEVAIAGKPAELLAYLICAHLSGGVATRSQIAGALFEGVTEANARKMLANVLYRLRQLLDTAAGHIVVSDQAIGLANVSIDAQRLVNALEHDQSPELATLLHHAREGLLPGLDHGWIAPIRARFQADVTARIEARLNRHSAANDKPATLVWAQHMLALDPAHEFACKTAMQTLAETGRIAEALALFDAHARALHDHLDLKPGAGLAELAATLRREQEMQHAAAQRIFVGRKAQRAEMLRWINAPDSQLLLLEGDPGIGKTTLLNVVIEAARWRGWRVGYGKSSRAVLPALLAPLAQAMSQAFHDADRARMTALLGEAAARRLFSLLDAQALPATDDHALLLEVVITQALEHAAQHSKLLLVLDDVHWAEPTLWHTLPALAAVCARTGMRIVATARPAELRANAAAWAAVQQAEADGMLGVHALHGLELEELALLANALGTPLDPTRHAELLRVSGGNPLVAHAWLAGGGVDAVIAGHVFASRLDALDAQSRQALAVLALAGHPLNYAAWTKCAQQPEIAVEPLLAAGLIAHTADGYAPAHDLLLTAVEGVLDDDARVAAHARLAHVLRGQADHAALAWHSEQAGQWAQAADHHCLSVESALRLSAHDHARSALESAVRCASRIAKPGALLLRIRLLALRLAQTRAWSGEQEAEAIALAADADAARELGVLLGVSHVQMRYLAVQSRYAEMADAGLRAQQLAEQLGDESTAILMAAEVSGMRIQHQMTYEKELQAVETLLQRAKRHGQPAPLAAVLLVLAALHQKASRLMLADGYLKQVDALREQHPALELDTQRYLTLKAGLQAWLHADREGSYALHMQRAVFARQTGDSQLLRNALNPAAKQALVMGRAEDALQHADEMLAESIKRQAAGDEPIVHYARATVCEVLLVLRDFERAEQVMEPAFAWLDTGAATGLPAFVCWVQRSMLRLEQHRFDEALEANAQVIAFDLGKGTLASVPLLMRALILNTAGRKDEARSYLERARPMIDPARTSDERQYMYWVEYSVMADPLALAHCRQGYMDAALRMPTPAIRRSAMTKRSSCRQVNAAWATLSQPCRKTIRMPGAGNEHIDVTWTPDDCLLDAVLAKTEDTATLRQHRLKRLTVEANMAGAFASHAELASALGVTVRTIERDVAEIQKQGIVLHTRKFMDR